MDFIVKKNFSKKPKLKNPIIIAGLPGIGNIGKICTDFIVEELNSKKLYEIYSSSFPHSVFINEEGIVNLPKVELHYIKRKPRDILVLSGDIQPLKEKESYDFAEKIISLCSEFKCKEAITLGGIGLPSSPQKKRIFITGTDKKIIKKYKKSSKEIKTKGNSAATILGIAGLLLGIGKLKNWKGISLLIETFADPYRLGLEEAKNLMKILEKTLNLGIDLKKLGNEVEKIEKEEKIENSKLMKKIKKISSENKDTSYIG